MRNKIVAVIFYTAYVGFAFGNQPVVITQEQLDQAIMENYGGIIVKPNSGRGSVVILNAQKRVSAEILDEALSNVRDTLQLRIEVKDGEISGLPTSHTAKAAGGTIVICLVDRNIDSNTLLLAPEEKWAVIDVAALARDNPTGKRLNNRVQKELIRAFGWLCGAGDSQFSGTVMGPAKSLTDLDRMANFELPIDSYGKIISYLKGLRVEPYVRSTYMDACIDGWAPAPTNEVQQAIWDKVHAPPKNPMKIEFDPKKGR